MASSVLKATPRRLPVSLTCCVPSPTAYMLRRPVLPVIRIGRDFNREPRMIPPGGVPFCASRLPSSAVGASLPPPLYRGDRARPASLAL